MPDYRNMSSVEALRHAKEKSGMTADEIALKLGTSTAVINRYLRQNGGYSPSLDVIPRLCSALDNTVLIDWLNAQVESPEAVPQAKDIADVFTAVARASAALGDVSRLLVESDHSGNAAGGAAGINAGRAREIRSGLENVKKACAQAQGQLQELAASDISKHVVLNHICLRDTGDRLEFPENRHLESSADLLSGSMKPAAFMGGQQEDMHMTASNDFPFGQIGNANSGRKTATLQSVQVSGEIRGLLFTYSIRQEYRNETKQALEVIYTFPVAWHTSLLGMTATIGGKELAAQVIEKSEAESQYEEALSGGDSAIMVQKSAKGLYTANLGNIKAGESVSIELHCAQLLSPQQGRIRVCVP
ncbi:MAG: helix-turn-helix domain-containing protein, partial [Deltaproteobacteria bacterium]|nr:helix-turn-helix domain-containing protein [Deltaproteobacteria bacterium]